MRSGLTVLIPTRSRPKRFKEAVSSLLKTSRAEVLAYLDDDDPESYPEMERVRYLRGPRLRHAKSLKILLAESDTDFLMYGSDDILFKTDGWDSKMSAAIPEDGIGLSFANDEWKGVASHFVFHRKWYELTGLYPDSFVHFGSDGYCVKVMEAVGRVRFLPRVTIAHMHFRNGRAGRDKTYDEEREFGDGRQELRDALREHFEKDVSILKAYLACTSTP